MPSRTLPFLRYRLKPHDRLVRAAAVSRDTYTKAYVVVDIGDGEFDVAFQSASEDSTSRRWDEGLTNEQMEEAVARHEGPPWAMNGPRLRKFRREWDDEALLITDLQAYEDRWPRVVTHPNGGWAEILTDPYNAPKRIWVEDDDWNPFLDESPGPEGTPSQRAFDSRVHAIKGGGVAVVGGAVRRIPREVPPVIRRAMLFRQRDML